MKPSVLLSVIVLALAVCSQTFAQAPRPPATQDVRAEFDKLKRDVARLNREISSLKQDQGPSLDEYNEVVAYLHTQAASATALKQVLVESEKLGFTWGINPESRILLLAGIEDLCTALESGVPGSEASSPDSEVTTDSQRQSASKIRDLMSAYEDSEDLINIGAYVQGSNPRIDEALYFRDNILNFLRQRQTDRITFDETCKWLDSCIALPETTEEQKSQGNVLAEEQLT
jgi:hypothetical protein